MPPTAWNLIIPLSRRHRRHNTLKPRTQHVETANSTRCLSPFNTFFPIDGWEAAGMSVFPMLAKYVLCCFWNHILYLLHPAVAVEANQEDDATETELYRHCNPYALQAKRSCQNGGQGDSH